MKALLFSASRSIGDTAQGYAWGRDQVLSLLLARYDLVLTSGVRGPEVWMEREAFLWGCHVVVFHADGRRVDSRGKGPTRWLSENLTPTGTRLRDEALATAATRAVQAGWSVTCVGLLDAGAESERSGTAHRLRVLESRGLPTHRIFWGQAPSEAAPVAAE